MCPFCLIDELLFAGALEFSDVEEGKLANYDTVYGPLADQHPRLDCTTRATMDFALLATLRVKTLTATMTCDTVQVTVVNNADYTQTTTVTSGSAQTFSADYQAAPGSEDRLPVDAMYVDEGRLLESFLGQYPSPTDEQYIDGGTYFQPVTDLNNNLPNFLRTALLLQTNPPTGSLPFVFSFVLIMMPEAKAPTVSAWGTQAVDEPDTTSVVPVTLLGQTFQGTAAHDAGPDPGTAAGGDGTGSSNTYTIYNATKLDIVAKDYWAYDGKFDTSTGEPATP